MNDVIMIERKIKVLAGDTFDQAMQGNVLRVTSAPVALRVRSRDGNVDMTLLEGERAVFPGEIGALILSHSSAADQVFKIQVGKGVEVLSAQVSGTVNVVNGETARVKNGQCFIGIAGPPQVAERYAMAQLWNPAGTGKNLILTKVNISSANVATGFGFAIYNAQLPAPVAALVSNKLIAGPAGVGVFCYTNNAALIGAAFANLWVDVASKTMEYTFSEPLIIPPGQGVIIYSGTQNNGMFVNMQWYEQAL